MIMKEEKRDLFDVDTYEYAIAHCISSDCKMGAGIAVPIKKRFKLNGLDKIYPPEKRKHPTCIYHNGVFNLITKRKYSSKPTLHSLRISLLIMKKLAQENGVNKIAMPRIGCGLDGLVWPEVKKVIEECFFETDIEILVCNK